MQSKNLSNLTTGIIMIEPKEGPNTYLSYYMDPKS